MTKAAFRQVRKKPRSYCNARRFGGRGGNKRSNQGRRALCAHNGLRPLPFRSERNPSQTFRDNRENTTRHRRKGSPNFDPFVPRVVFDFRAPAFNPYRRTLPSRCIYATSPLAGSSLAGGTRPAPIPISTGRAQDGSSRKYRARECTKWLQLNQKDKYMKH